MKFDIKKIIEWLSYILRCPVCGQKYNIDQTRIIESKEGKPNTSDNMLVHTDCSHCRASVVFSITIDGPEIFSVGMITDLTSQDTSKFRNKVPVTPDEVLAAHQFLKDFDGDFRSILK